MKAQIDRLCYAHTALFTAESAERLADMLVDYNLQLAANALAVGADAISVGDDYGTQQAMMISPRACNCRPRPVMR